MTEHAVPIPETPQVPVVPPVQTRPPKVRTRPTSSLLDPSILRCAVLEAFVKLDPRTMIRNPVMFVVEIGSVITTVEFFARPDVFVGLVTLWLWATVLFANFAEAVAEGRGKAQADTLRRGRQETMAHLLRPDGTTQEIPAAQLRAGNLHRGNGRAGHPRRRRRGRGDGGRRRVGHHGRVGPGDPRVGR